MMRSENKIFSSVRTALESVLPPIGIAFSGGLDSTVLLDAATKILAPEKFRAIHVCHHLRPEKELETELDLVRNFCRGRGVPLSVVNIAQGSIEAFAQKKKCGLEAAARIFRYRAFKRVAVQFGVSVIFLAHHQDDQLETILMRFLHGGSVGSLIGIEPTRVISVDPRITVQRPFLGIPREDILNYAKSADLRWSEDSTNAESAYFRNKVRKTIVPVLDHHFQFWRSACLSYQTQIRDLIDMVRVQAREKLINFERTVNGKPALNTEMLRAEPSMLRIEILRLYTALFPAAQPMRNRGLRHLEARIIEGAPNIEASGNIFELKHNVLVFKGSAKYSSSYERRVLSSLDSALQEHWYYIKIESMGEFNCGPFKLRVAREPALKSLQGELAEAKKREYAIPVKVPFVIRNTRQGDMLKSIHGITAIESILKKMKLPTSSRAFVPIVEDEIGIAAVLPTAIMPGEGTQDIFREPTLGERVQIVYIFLSMKGDQCNNV